MTKAELTAEVERLKSLLDRAAIMLAQYHADSFPGRWFVTGEYGEKDRNGLPETITVCPAYGCDWSQAYQRTDKTCGAEW